MSKNPENPSGNDAIYPFDMDGLPEFFQRKAERELNDFPEIREKGLKELRELTKSECQRIVSSFEDKVFKGGVLSDDFLLLYLRCRKYNALKAFKQLQNLMNLTRKQPLAFTNIKFDNLAVTTRNKIVTYLPYRCQDGCAILLIELDNWEPAEFPVEEIKRLVVIYLVQALRNPMTQVNGIKVIFDVKSNPIKHIKYATPSNIHLLYYGPVECSPGRFKAIHILNDSITFQLAFFLIKPFLSKKIRQRIILHSKPEGLLDYFPKSVMPEQYGGDLKDYDMTPWLRKVAQTDMLAELAGWTSTNRTQS